MALRINGVTDILGKTVLVQRSPQNGVTDLVRNLYDIAGNLVSSAESSGQSTFSTSAFTYDGLNRVVAQHAACGGGAVANDCFQRVNTNINDLNSWFFQNKFLFLYFGLRSQHQKQNE